MSVDKQIKTAIERTQLVQDTAKRTSAFHSAYMVAAQFKDFVLDAPFVQDTPELTEEARDLFVRIEAFYQRVGVVAFPQGEITTA